MNDLIVSIVGKDMAESLKPLIPEINYYIDYKAAWGKGESTVAMDLTTKPMAIDIAGLFEVNVTITADKGIYDVSSKNLKFDLNVDKVQLGDGEPMDVALKLEFDADKK